MQPTGAAEAMRAKASTKTAELKRGHNACSRQAQRRPCKRKPATKQPSSSEAITHAAHRRGAGNASVSEQPNSRANAGHHACSLQAQRRQRERKRASK